MMVMMKMHDDADKHANDGQNDVHHDGDDDDEYY